MFRRLLTSLRDSRLDRPPAQSAPVRHEVFLAGETRLVLVRRTARTQRYTLRLKPGTRDLVVTMPPRGSMAMLNAFLKRNEGWIDARLSRLPEQIAFADGASIPISGIEHRILHQLGKRGTAWLDADAAGPFLAVAGKPEHLARRVRDFLRKKARLELEAATQKYALGIKVSIKRVSIKDTRSRWGSCSSQGAISYSWRIVMAPDYVLDYLAAHEVAHRREMNHSPRFWKLLRGMCAETDRAEIWLKKNGTSLHNYG